MLTIPYTPKPFEYPYLDLVQDEGGYVHYAEGRYQYGKLIYEKRPTAAELWAKIQRDMIEDQKALFEGRYGDRIDSR